MGLVENDITPKRDALAGTLLDPCAQMVRRPDSRLFDDLGGPQFVRVKRRFFMTISEVSARWIQDYMGEILGPLFGMKCSAARTWSTKGRP